MTTLAEAVVVVTGGATGLGRALAVEVSSRGARVVVASVSDASETVDMIRAEGGRAEWFGCDVSDYDAFVALADFARVTYGGINVLINNAAAGVEAAGLDTADPVQAKRLFEVNVLGVFNGIRACAADLKAAAADGQPAYILNVGSEHSLGVPPHVMPLSTYTVSKYTGLAFTDVARRDFEGTGVGVTLVAPGWILTERVRELIAHSEEAREAIEPFAQTGAEVARQAIDGLLAGRYIVATNSASRKFAMEHAREVMGEIQQLPLDDQLTDDVSYVHDGTGDPAKCPVPHHLFH